MAILIGIIFIAVGVFFLWLSRRTKARSSAAAQWPTVPGRVIDSRVVEHETWNAETNRNERTLAARIVYDYQVGNMMYRAERFGIGTSVASPQAAVQQHPVGAIVQVHFNPQNPGDAALYVTKSQGCFYIAFGVIFLIFGLMALLVGIVLMRAH